MPPVIGVIVGVITAIGTGVAAAATAIGAGALVAGVSATAIGLTTIVVGGSLLMVGIEHWTGALSTPSSLTSDAATHSVAVRQAAAPRRILYGECANGGVVTYVATTGNSAQYLHLVVTFAGNPIDSIVALYFDDYQLVLDGGDHGNETDRYQGYVTVERKLGQPGEAAFPGLIAATAGLNGGWTSAHRQDGCCSVHFQLLWDATLFPNGVPTIWGVFRGKQVYDPRSGTTAWSNNAALCVRDALMDRQYGLRLLPGEMNDAILSAAANTCDELVPLAAGGTEARYTANGGYDSSMSIGDVLGGLYTAAAGKMSIIGGQWCYFPGAWRAPALSIGDDDLRGPLQLTGKIGRRNSYNVVAGTFISPLNAWQASNFPWMVKAGYVCSDSGIEGTHDRGFWGSGTAYAVKDSIISLGQAYYCTAAHTASNATQPGMGANWQTYWALAPEIAVKQVEYPFTTSAATAQRLAAIDLEQGRRPITLAAPCKMTVYQGIPPDVVNFTHARWGWTNKTFEINRSTFQQEQDGALGVDFTLLETDPGIYDWSSSQEQPFNGTLTPASANPSGSVASVTNLLATSTHAYANANGPRIYCTWASPQDARVTSGGYIVIATSPAGANAWTNAPQVAGSATSAYVGDGILTAGSSYDVMVIAYTSGGAASLPAYVHGVTAVA